MILFINTVNVNPYQFESIYNMNIISLSSMTYALWWTRLTYFRGYRFVVRCSLILFYFLYLNIAIMNWLLSRKWSQMHRLQINRTCTYEEIAVLVQCIAFSSYLSKMCYSDDFCTGQLKTILYHMFFPTLNARWYNFFRLFGRK